MISPFCGSGNVLDYLNENKNVDKLAIVRQTLSIHI